jgi:hypothetical protein
VCESVSRGKILVSLKSPRWWARDGKLCPPKSVKSAKVKPTAQKRSIIRGWLSTRRRRSMRLIKTIWRTSGPSTLRPRKVSFPGFFFSHPLRAITFLEGKRSKLEAETISSGANNSHEQTNRPENRKLSLATADSFSPSHPRSEQSPSIGPVRLPTGAYTSSKSTSPATHPISGFNSPRVVEYSPKSTSPRPTMTPKEAAFDSSTSHLTREFRGQMDLYSSYPSAPYAASHHHHHPSIVTATHHPYTTTFTDHPSRRPMLDYGILPPLTREDTTLSSESGQSNYSLPLVGPNGQSPSVDSTKSSRVLPQPVPSIVAMPLQLDRSLPSGSCAPILPPPHDYRSQGSLSVLARAGELAASSADDGKQEGLP